MKKMILNGCFGGFSWSKEAKEVLEKLGIDSYDNDCRTNPIAISILETKGPEWCSGESASLYIAEYDDELYNATIDEYDGAENIRLYPCIKESKLFPMTKEEIIDLLKDVGVVDKDVDDNERALEQRELMDAEAELYANADDPDWVTSHVDLIQRINNLRAKLDM